MSWENYVHVRSCHGPHPDFCGYRRSRWLCSSSKFPEIKPEEVAALVDAFNSDGDNLAQRGLFIGGEKYLVIQGEQGVVIRGKKGAGGATIKKTNLCMVFGIYDGPVTGGECNSVVEKLGDYLVEQGY